MLLDMQCQKNLKAINQAVEPALDKHQAKWLQGSVHLGYRSGWHCGLTVLKGWSMVEDKKKVLE